MIPHELRAMVSKTAPKGQSHIQHAISQISKLDFTPMFDFDLRLKLDEDLRSRFIANPNAVVTAETLSHPLI